LTNEYQNDPGASARPHDSDSDPAGTPAGEQGAGPGLRWGIAGFLALVAVLAAAALVLEVTSLRPRSEEVRADQQARSEVVRAAERFAVQVNNYDVSSVGGYQAKITPLLSPKFKGEFEKAMTDIVTSVKQAKMTSKGEVLSSGVASLDPDSAQVLVVSDANVKTVFDQRARHFRWEVSLVKIDGKWLIDNFTPVA
jgi:Mce-associated membrane protein